MNHGACGGDWFALEPRDSPVAGRRSPLTTVRYSIPTARLPVGVEQLSILLVSDLHVNRRPHPSLAALEGLAGARPDLLIAAGDLVESERFIPDVGQAVGADPNTSGRLCGLGQPRRDGQAKAGRPALAAA